MSLENKVNYDHNLSSNTSFLNIKVTLANKNSIELQWEFTGAFDVFKIIKQNRDLWDTVYWQVTSFNYFCLCNNVKTHSIINFLIFKGPQKALQSRVSRTKCLL